MARISRDCHTRERNLFEILVEFNCAQYERRHGVARDHTRERRLRVSISRGLPFRVRESYVRVQVDVFFGADQRLIRNRAFTRVSVAECTRRCESRNAG